MGDKINARNLMQAAGVPVAPGTQGPVVCADGTTDRSAGWGRRRIVAP